MTISTRRAGNYAQILVDGYELTGDLNQLTLSDVRDTHDITAFGDAVHHFITGQQVSLLEHAGFLNAQVARTHPVLKDVGVDGIVSVILGQNAAPAAGDPMYSLLALQGFYSSMPAFGSYVPFTAQFVSVGQRGGWGIALAVPLSIDESGAGAAIDNGAASSGGGAAALHLLAAAASDTYTIRVEGSSSGMFAGEEATLATFALDGSQLGSEQIAIPGILPRYVRWRAIRNGTAGDTVRLAINLTRFA